jgi:hypothetical protein
MMKKTYKSSLLALSVLASFTSCSESESLQQANLSKDKITFHATLDNSWKPLSPASSSRAAIAAATEKGPIVVSTPFGKPLYLHPVVQDGIHIWSKEGKPITRSGAPLEDVEHERVAQTRGSMKDNIGAYGSFGVTAIYKNGENNLSLFQEENGNPKIAVATSTNEDKVWEIKDSRWPVGSEVSFHAFAPYSAGSTSPLGFKPDVDNEKTQITYTASTTDIVNQPDLIFATAKGSQSDNALDLNFNHALTAVTFAIDKDLADVLGAGKKLTSITLSGIPNEGTYELAVMKGEGNAAPEWQFAQDGGSNKIGTYTFDLKNQDIVTGKDFALTSDNNTLMMIPQTLPESAKLNFQFDLDGVLQSLIIDMKDQVWQPGKSVIYKLSASAINTLSNPEVIFPDNTEWAKVGYPKSSFVDGDAIGLYAVSKDGLVVIPNVKLTKGQDGIWKTENNQRFLFTTNYSYFAYYPYRNTPDPLDVNIKATTADEFFKEKIDKWEPAKVQNEESALVSQDLQVASGVVKADASTLEFKMAHKVSLAVLTLSDKKIPVTCYFKDNSYMYYYGDKTITPNISKTEGEQTLTASTDFKDHVPYCINKGTKYLQIIPLGVQTSFKAGNPNDDTRTHWGFFKSHSLTPTESTPQELSIQADPAFINGVRDFEYDTRYNPVTGAGAGNETEFVQEFVVPEDATYKLECWGASSAKQTAWYGYGYPDNGGGYSKGDAKLKVTQTLYVCVGGEGTPNVTNQPGYGTRYGGFGGYNGGTNPRNGNYNGGSTGGSGGGGATHIGFKKALLTAFRNDYDTQLIMVAGGRGGDSYHHTGGCGGGDVGGICYSVSQSATATTNYYGNGNFIDPKGNNIPWWYVFGAGSIGRIATGRENGSGGGGGGFWGGWVANNCPSAGGGGTGYINKAFLDSEAKTIAGDQLFDSPSGVQERGHKGHGAAKISWEAKKCFNP